MQRDHLRPGQAVRIRGERWRILSERAYGDVSIVEADGCDTSNRGTIASFVLPLEPVERLSPSHAPPRLVSASRWRRAARACLAEAVPRWTSLRSALRARLTIIPFQLEPALAAMRGDSVRLLIADDVGLGKTIQAGLIVAETVARTPDAHVLIVAPAGLREQWRDELQYRFMLNPEVLDATGLARAETSLGPHVNPWSVHPVTITSIDYVKRPEVMRSLEGLLWDVMVFDEAHTLGGRSDRAGAAAGLASRARSVVLLTATPHSGDEETFARLCDLGDIGTGFPLLTFRRARADVGLPHGRRSIVLRIRPTASEVAMHTALASYSKLLVTHAGGSTPTSAAGLVAAILVRRARSSAGSLARSLERRMALLADRPVAPLDQPALPFPGWLDDEEPGLELGAAGLKDVMEEQRWLDRLLRLAQEASRGESKVEALRRLLRRLNEPAIVFTEFRDTLRSLASALEDFDPRCLHGGLTATERRRALREFDQPQVRLLLATDAASEGLNLQRRCRVVVNLDLPWTPTRLEQRVGRVDRIGQQLRVHAVMLVARGTDEEFAATRLAVRSTRARQALRRAGAHPVGPERPPLSEEANREADWLQAARRLLDGADARRAIDRPALTVIRCPKGTPRCTWAFRLPILDAADHVIFETIVALDDRRGGWGMDEELERAIADAHRRLVSTLFPAIALWRQGMARREDAIADVLRAQCARIAAGLLQPGLFEGRAQRAAAAQRAIFEEAAARSRACHARLERLAHLHEDERTVVFAVAYR